MSKTPKNHKVRKVTRTSWIFEKFSIPNPHTGKMLKCDGPLERDFALKNVFDPDVIYIDTQPQSFFSEATGRRYTRDTVIGKKDATITNHECKTSEALESPKNKLKFELIGREIRDAGGNFETTSELDIHDGDLILNLKTLHPYRSVTPPTKDTIELIQKTVASHPRYTLGELVKRSRISAFSVREVWYCLAYKHLLTDLTRRIDKKSIIWSEHDAI